MRAVSEIHGYCHVTYVTAMSVSHAALRTLCISNLGFKLRFHPWYALYESDKKWNTLKSKNVIPHVRSATKPIVPCSDWCESDCWIQKFTTPGHKFLDSTVRFEYPGRLSGEKYLRRGEGCLKHMDAPGGGWPLSTPHSMRPISARVKEDKIGELFFEFTLKQFATILNKTIQFIHYQKQFATESGRVKILTFVTRCKHFFKQHSRLSVCVRLWSICSSILSIRSLQTIISVSLS